MKIDLTKEELDRILCWYNFVEDESCNEKIDDKLGDKIKEYVDKTIKEDIYGQ